MVFIKRFDTGTKISGSYDGHCPTIGWRKIAIALIHGSRLFLCLEKA
jgi:hypothetical protein